MKNILFISVFIITNTIYSQDILWEKSYGGIHGDYLFDVQPTQDFGFILAGSSVSDKTGSKQERNIGNLDYWVWKMDEFGALVWQKTLGGTGVDLLQKIITTKDGGFLLAGSSDSVDDGTKKDRGFGLEDFWIIKLNPDGTEQWQKTYGGYSSDYVTSAIETSSGGYLIAGSSSSSISGSKTTDTYGNKDFWILQLNNQGQVEWETSFGGLYLDEVKSITQTLDNGFFVLGYSNSPESETKQTVGLGNGDFWLIRLDDKGNSLWQKSYGGEGDDLPTTMISLKSGNTLLGGVSNTSNSPTKQSKNEKGTDIWLINIDDRGEIYWEKTFNIGSFDMLASLHENKDQTILLGGYTRSEKTGTKKKDNEGVNDYVAIKIDKQGKEKWRKEIGSNGDDMLVKLIKTRDGGYLLAGTTNGKVSGSKSSIKGLHDFWIVKLGDKKNEDDLSNIPLLEAYPNPTAGFTNIIITKDFEKGKAYLYDIQGRMIENYILKDRTLPINLSNLPIGVYLVNVETNTDSGSVKIIKKN